MTQSTTQRGAAAHARSLAHGSARMRSSARVQRNPFLVAAGLVRAPAGTPGRIYQQSMSVDDEVVA